MPAPTPATPLLQVFTALTHSANVDVHDVISTDAGIHQLHANAEQFDRKTELSFKYLQVGGWVGAAAAADAAAAIATIDAAADATSKHAPQPQVFTACCNSFAHGSNDVANSIGPFAGIYSEPPLGLLVLSSPASCPGMQHAACRMQGQEARCGSGSDREQSCRQPC